MSSDTEDYVMVSKSEAEHEEGLRQRRETAPEAPRTPMRSSAPRDAEKAGPSTPQPGGYLEVVQAQIVCLFLVGLEQGARCCIAIKQMVPVAAATVVSLAEQCTRYVRDKDWQALRQLAAAQASHAATKLTSLAQAAAPVVHSTSLAVYTCVLQHGCAAVAAVVFVVEHPADCWLRAVTAFSSFQDAAWRAYDRVDPNHRLVHSLVSLLQYAVVLYTKADPDHKALAKARALKARGAPIVHAAAARCEAGVRWARPYIVFTWEHAAHGVRWVKPHLVAAWEHVMPAAQRTWALAGETWNAPGVGWLFMLAGAVGAAGCAVALLGLV